MSKDRGGAVEVDIVCTIKGYQSPNFLQLSVLRGKWTKSGEIQAGGVETGFAEQGDMPSVCRHETVKLLLKKGADVEVKYPDGQTALALAVLNRHKAIVKLLPEKGADIEAEDRNGRTALALVALDNHEMILKLLISITPDS
ncbi:hypothetical protein FGG08_005562 [Glutinoglossum americanum]|uniref:Uncharacterized protein n=1 Tax=Glutinoglossum americanum TaxID=1670608 RepID=A0A9P8HU96_9PEZI|nr:hypothetical protein FGG08_005562 [Glutinoglossum americanum]